MAGNVKMQDHKHSTFLHLWQHKTLATENSGAEDNADAIRLKLAQLQVLKREVSTIDDYAVAKGSQKLLEDYGKLMDKSEKDGGLNNYADPILFLLATSKNESKEWSSKLKASDIIKKYIPNKSKSNATLKEEYNKLANLLNTSQEFNVNKAPLKKESDGVKNSVDSQEGLGSSEINALFDPWDEQDLQQEQKRDQQANPLIINGSSGGKDIGASWGRGGGRGAPFTYPGPDTGGWGDPYTRGRGGGRRGSRGGRGVNGRGGRGAGYNREHQGPYNDREDDMQGGGGGMWRGRGASNRHNGRSGRKSSERGQGRHPWSRRGDNDWNDDRMTDNGNDERNNCFKTASHQLAIEQQKRFGRGGGVAESSYGSSQRSLGVRRYVNNKFVPPVRREDEEGGYYGSEVVRRCMPQANGGRGGAGNGEDNPYAYLMSDERLKNIEPKMVELIMNEIMDSGPPVTWDDIAGLTLAKNTIQEIVVWPMLRPDIFTGLRGPPKGLLLFGPPGTGKTMIGKCIACQSGSTFFSISASSLTSKWIGDGEKMVRAMFAVARCHQPAVIFIDEIDSLLSQRSDTEHESSRRIKTEFLVQLDGATTEGDERLLVVGATNRPQELDEAARRRLVKKLYISLPEIQARQQIIEKLLKDQSHSLDGSDIERICSLTDGYSGADMANLCREAALGPIRSINFADIRNISVDQVRAITVNDFVNALSSIKASVTDNDLQLYEDWNKKFGISVK